MERKASKNSKATEERELYEWNEQEGEKERNSQRVSSYQE